MRNVNVSAAIILRDSKILVTQRGYGKYKDHWEFPGGKLEEGEQPWDALTRELSEELRISVKKRKYLGVVEADYEDFHLSMHCFVCDSLTPNLTLLEHEDARFVDKKELMGMDLLPGDRLILPRLFDYLTQIS